MAYLPEKSSMTDEEAERIDQFLGNGILAKWNIYDFEARTQVKRANRIDDMLWKLKNNNNLIGLSPYGTDWVEKLWNDFKWGMDLIKSKNYPDPAQFQPLLKIFPVALDTAELMMDDAEAIPAIWMISGAVALPVIGFTGAAARLHSELLELEKLLKEALRHQVSGTVKAVLGMAITTIGLMNPGLSLLAKGAMVLAEAYLSGPTTVAGGTKYAKFAAESVATIEKAGATIHHVAHRGGQALAVTGFYFDIQEIRHVVGNVDKIKSLLKKADKDYKKFKGKLREAVLVYERFERNLRTRSYPIRRKIDDKRRERDDLIAQNSYYLNKPIAWRIVVKS